MSKALPGSHFCVDHQGNHSHYAKHNCELCVALAEVEALRALLDRVICSIGTYDQGLQSHYQQLRNAALAAKE